MIEETLKLESKIRPAFFKYATQNGGREIRADFFMAKWAVRQGWSRDEFEEIIIKSLGKSGHYSELSFYPGSREARRYLILWYYDKISQDKDMWLNLPNDTNTIKNYIEKLYTD
jgi:hypothetical protein